MALLNVKPSGHFWRRRLEFLLGLTLALGASPLRAEPAPEYQVKAVFLFNFTQFVDWPAAAFPTPSAPFVIGVFGEDPFGHSLDDVVRGEKTGGHPLVVKRCHDLADAAACHMVFLSQSSMSQVGALLAGVQGRSILTVGDGEDFARHGGMIRFMAANGKIRLRINLEATRSAGLVISSKLLRPAEIVPAEKN